MRRVRVANSYGTAIDKPKPDEATEVYIYIDEAGGQTLPSPICIVFEEWKDVKEFAVDLMKQGNVLLTKSERVDKERFEYAVDVLLEHKRVLETFGSGNSIVELADIQDAIDNLYAIRECV